MDLAIISPGLVTDEQKAAWAEYKNYRNKINSKKKFEERNYKREKMLQNIDDPAKMWRTSKEFMNWKSTGIPTQLEVNNVLITSAGSIADLMNNFFIDKVNLIRAGKRNVAANFSSCVEIMQNKHSKLNLGHFSVEKVKQLISSK